MKASGQHSAIPSGKEALFSGTVVIGVAISLIMTLLLGALPALLAALRWPRLSRQYALAASAGLVAGESITGVGASFRQMFRGA